MSTWLDLLPADPRGWLLESGEPSARWIALTCLCGRDSGDRETKAAKQALLADLGLGAGDHPRVERFLDQLLAHQDEEGRFQARSKWRGRALDRMAADTAATAQGWGWPCRPEPVTQFRGLGRRSDFCPQVTLEALRAWPVRGEDKGCGGHWIGGWGGVTGQGEIRATVACQEAKLRDAKHTGRQTAGR